ncbi:superoxide response transcriptional regulator SoxS [Erwinia amylovora]|uniref:HTH-type transcriptional regulator soxS n=1 Tax=Erwinia amylovora ATCC BAA-2158 TaxID=889211 RepID=E5B9H2_ERWAM|nr:superoxide response transcriptional regulator SoxS [Erwinia amylovora]CBX82184.1 HTH-type transcriptional regulator soxS [Erwinia amylovora ATCC BAA-2158]
MHDDIINTLTNWIDNNLDKALSIEEVAAKSGYSKWHLQRMFRTVTKQTLGGYIRERRLMRAAEALRQSQRPVFDIAMQYGYDSQQTFSRVFRRQFSQTPTAYRNTMRRQRLQRSSWNFDCGDYPASSFQPQRNDKSCPICN